MCSECGEDHEPVCFFCGVDCYGNCEDQDTCPSCWTGKNDPMGLFMDEFDEEAHFECMEEECLCGCHDDDRDEMGLRYEHGVLKNDEDDPPYIRKGTFPFLKLPGEIREKVYGYAFLQDGTRREIESTNHRGTIHTALLGTCRQVYKEAGHLPLSLNKLNFPSALYALDFLGFIMVPTQKTLVTAIHIEFYFHEFNSPTWSLLLRQLAKLPITQLSLTIKGGYAKEALLGHQCFSNRLAAYMKGLKSFDVTLGSGLITKKIKGDIQEEMRERLIKGYKRPKQSKAKAKRNATSDISDSKKNMKKAKKAVQIPKHQAKLIHFPKSGRLGMRSDRPERQAAEAAEAAKERIKQSLFAQYEQIKQYATSLDLDVAPVKIRLEDARKAMEASDEFKFDKLARSIMLTLEERHDKIAAARNDIQAHLRSTRPLTPNEPSSSQNSEEYSDMDSSEECY